QWSESLGNFKVDTVNGKLTNNANASSNNASLATLNLTTNAADESVSAYIDVTTANSYAGLVARWNNANNGTGYYADVTASGTALNFRIIRVVNGNYGTTVGSGTITGTGKGTMSLEVFGSSQKLFFDSRSGPQLAAFATDANVTAAGTVGVRATGAATFTNVSADAIATSSVTLPFGPEPFTSATNGQLSRQWSESLGNFKVDT